MILAKYRMDMGNMLIFGPQFVHIFSVQHVVRSAQGGDNIDKILIIG